MPTYSGCYTCMNETKKGGETSKSKRGNMGIANMHKKYRRQDRDPGWLDSIAASGICTSRHASTSPILSQRYPSIRAVP